MKKIIFIIFLLYSINSFAQHKPFQFGFKGAVNIGWFGTDLKVYSNEGTEIGGSWGFVADIYLMENYAFTTGFDVLFLNGTLTYPHIMQDTIGGQMESTFKKKYIEIPIIFTMRTNQIGKLRYYGQIGFGFGILLNAKVDNTFTPADGGEAISNEGEDSGLFRSTRESFIIGGGIEIPLTGSTFIRTGIKYDNAFINVMKGNNTANSDVSNNARNNYFELNLCLLF